MPGRILGGGLLGGFAGAKKPKKGARSRKPGSLAKGGTVTVGARVKPGRAKGRKKPGRVGVRLRQRP